MGRPPVPLDWVNAPRQARSHKTLENLLDAAERILCERGLDAVTVPEVVKVARSSVGSFYTRFPDKQALLVTLHERACAQTLATADAAFDPSLWEHASTAAVVREVVCFAVRVFGTRRTIMSAFARSFAGDPSFAARRARTATRLAERLQRLLLARHADIGHPDAARAIAMGLRVVTATLEQRNALAESGLPEVELDDEVLAEELARMVSAYLALAPCEAG